MQFLNKSMCWNFCKMPDKVHIFQGLIPPYATPILIGLKDNIKMLNLRGRMWKPIFVKPNSSWAELKIVPFGSGSISGSGKNNSISCLKLNFELFGKHLMKGWSTPAPCRPSFDQKATSKGNLTIHKRAVHEGVKYPCNQCDFKATSNCPFQSWNIARALRACSRKKFGRLQKDLWKLPWNCRQN